MRCLSLHPGNMALHSCRMCWLTIKAVKAQRRGQKPEEVQQIVLEKLEQLKGDLDGGEVHSE